MNHHTKYVQKKPNTPVIISAASGKIVTWQQFSSRVNKIAQYFRDIGLKEKDHIAILLENCTTFFEIIEAATDAGLIYTLISTHLKKEETEYVINNCDAKLLITSGMFADLVGQIAAITSDLSHRMILGTAIDGYDSFEETIAKYDGIPIDYSMSGMPMNYSSGTTGYPRGITWDVPDFPVGMLDPTQKAANDRLGLNDETIYLSTQPLYHSAPSSFAMKVIRLGGTVVLMEKFDAEEALCLIEKHRATHSQWIPTMFIRILKLPDETRANYDISSMQMAIHAAAPCPVKVKEQMIEWWGPILFEYWGGSETSLVTTITSQEWLNHKGSVGKAINTKLHIMDETEKEELPPFESGIIYIESVRPFSYYKEPEKTASCRNEKGWAQIGDIGYLDEEGYLYLTDRKSFMIISGGVNIYPQETEDLLVLHPKVVDVAVIGIPNDEFGEEVKAVVQLADMAEAGPSLEKELIEYCRSRISHIKCPKTIDFVNELARTPAGKLLKRVIREKYL